MGKIVLLTLEQAKTYANVRKTVIVNLIIANLLHIVDEKYVDADELDIIIAANNNEEYEYKDIPLYSLENINELMFQPYMSKYHGKQVDAIYIDHICRFVYRNEAHKLINAYIIKRKNNSGDVILAVMEKEKFEKLYTKQIKEKILKQDDFANAINRGMQILKQERKT